MILLADGTWEVRDTPEKGRGLFTKATLQSGTVIGDYLGTVIKISESNTREAEIGMYLMYYHDNAAIYPEDLEAPGMHLINHSCQPNCWMYVYQGHTLFFTIRQIEPGEELTVSYLLAPSKSCTPCPHVCRCGVTNCTRTMHLSEEKYKVWSEFAKVQSKATKRARVRYDRPLKPLAIYPDRLPYHPIYEQVTPSSAG